MIPTSKEITVRPLLIICYGETKSDCERAICRTAKIITPRRYQDYVHILGSWSHGGKQVYLKFRRTQGKKQNAYAVVKNFYLKRVNLVRGVNELVLMRKESEDNRGGVVCPLTRVFDAIYWTHRNIPSSFAPKYDLEFGRSSNIRETRRWTQLWSNRVFEDTVCFWTNANCNQGNDH
jgi:hypothetical protein